MILVCDVIREMGSGGFEPQNKPGIASNMAKSTMQKKKDIGAPHVPSMASMVRQCLCMSAIRGADHISW